MQPTVIPFDLTFSWFTITILILTGAMLVIQWLMKRWTFWQKEFTPWTKLKRFEQEEEGEAAAAVEEEEEEANRGSRGDAIPINRFMAARDLESLGTRALSGRRNVL